MKFVRVICIKSLIAIAREEVREILLYGHKRARRLDVLLALCASTFALVPLCFIFCTIYKALFFFFSISFAVLLDTIELVCYRQNVVSSAFASA
jgi:hypothetical protein